MGRCWPQLVSNSFPLYRLAVLVILTISIAADESLKFWKLFEKKPGAASAAREGSANPKANLVKQMTIR